MDVLIIIFWMCIFLLIYPYLIYPVLLKLLPGAGHPEPQAVDDDAKLPSVTFIISVYNEAQVIEEKLANALALDYPSDKLEIMVISDASSDRTEAIVQEWAGKHPQIRLVRQQQRRGKTAGLNAGIRQSRGEAIVFSDANAMYKADAVRELVKYFSNPDVGYVMGAALYTEGADSEASESEGLYWKFELALKKLETEYYSVVGGDGAIYAIRRELYWPLEDDDINDFVNPLQIVAKGYRGVFNPDAICYEDAGGEFSKEFKRKRRIVNRSWRAVKRYISWFDVQKQMKFLFELFSHKVIRWFSMGILLVLFLTNLALILFGTAVFFKVTFIGQVVMIIAALYGAYLDGKGRSIPKVVYLPYYFFLVNYAALLGIWDESRGIKHVVWDHVRES